jgi:glycosyltransferase involved in cell wall biosynthesis
VIPYGVDADRFQPSTAARIEFRRRINISDDVPLIAAAGRLVSKKGFEYLIDALARVDDAVLALAGDGTLGEELRARAAHANVSERVIFLGNQSQDDVSRLFASADLIATPSVRDESGNVDGLPNVVMEALASGTPLVTTTAGGIGSVVTDGETALVVPEKDAVALATALQRLVGNRALGDQLAAAARALVRSRYGWSHTAAQFEDAYRRALVFASTGR